MKHIYPILSASLLFIISGTNAFSQEIPYRPVAIQVFNPFIFNPAIAGSKDFASLDFLFSSLGKSNSELLSYESRITGKAENYSNSPGSPEFTNLGLGAYVFHISDGVRNNTGLNASLAYHIRLDDKALSFLAVGASASVILNSYSGEPDLARPAKKTSYPELGTGIYYYSPQLIAGISAINLLGNPIKPDTLGFSPTQVSRQYIFLAGYKIVLSRNLKLLVEPSLTLKYTQGLSNDASSILKPGLKVYAGNFCAGTYFNDFNKASFFIQTNYNILHMGAYFELPFRSAYFRSPLLAELKVGVDISALRAGISRKNHW